MLSVSKPDKSSQFINKIDGVAYHQFLLCVFPIHPLKSIRAISPAHILSARVQACSGVKTGCTYQTTPWQVHSTFARSDVNKCFKASTQFCLYVLSLSAMTLKPLMVEVSTVDQLTVVQDSDRRAWILKTKGFKMPQTELCLSYMRCTHPWVPSENISCGHDRCHFVCPWF